MPFNTSEQEKLRMFPDINGTNLWDKSLGWQGYQLQSTLKSTRGGTYYIWGKGDLLKLKYIGILLQQWVSPYCSGRFWHQALAISSINWKKTEPWSTDQRTWRLMIYYSNHISQNVGHTKLKMALLLQLPISKIHYLAITPPCWEDHAFVLCECIFNIVANCKGQQLATTRMFVS